MFKRCRIGEWVSSSDPDTCRRNGQRNHHFWPINISQQAQIGLGL